MKVTVCPSDRGGCGYIRLRWPAEALAAQGVDVECVEALPAVWERHPTGDRVVGAYTFGADVVVFQRIYRPELVTLMRGLKAQGVAVVMDIDDDLMALDPRHAMYAGLRDRKALAHLREAVQVADIVTVSTPALAAKYGGDKARVVRNGIPRAYLSIEKHRAPAVPSIGWTGIPTTHVGDLDVMGTSVAEVCTGTTARFRAIGSADTCAALGVAGEYVPGAPLATLDYARLYAELDIAVVPLADTAFNRSKSWLKGIEAAALGVPFVASPRSEYIELHALGAGLLAERPREWKRHLVALARSPDMRLALAARGRAVAAQHTIEDTTAPQMFEAWVAAREGKLVPV